jgi:hypothetical protein
MVCESKFEEIFSFHNFASQVSNMPLNLCHYVGNFYKLQELENTFSVIWLQVAGIAQSV